MAARSTEWLDLTSLQQYADVSNRTLRLWIHRADNPLPAAQVGRKILVRKREFDRWLRQHRSPKSADTVKAIVDDVMKGMRR